jgi:uncharacterized protein with ATP-grasp and redox domains
VFAASLLSQDRVESCRGFGYEEPCAGIRFSIFITVRHPGSNLNYGPLMIAYLDCYPCLVRHLLEAARLVIEDPVRQTAVVQQAMSRLAAMDPQATPIRMATEMHTVLRAEPGAEDPYREKKIASNRLALQRIPMLKQRIDAAADPLEVAVRIAIAGNIIDFAALGENFDVDQALEESLAAPLDAADLQRFRGALEKARRIVYVGDNAGEIIFDRLLLDRIRARFDPEITFVVRGGAILNDVTLEDAKTAGIDGIARVIASAGHVPGCEVKRSSPDVQEAFQKADLIVSKGQGNYEALSDEPYPVFFLLRVKCPVIARDIGAPEGSSVIRFRGRQSEKIGK